MLSRLCKPSKIQSFFLFGPRGVGKSTLLKTVFPAESAYKVDLLDYETEARLAVRPTLLLEEWDAQPAATKKSRWIVIDEVQRLPKLLDVVHHGIEEKKLSFALTGSSARQLRRGTANLLAGRAVEYKLHPFTSFELGSKFNLDDAINWGTLPKIFSLGGDEAEIRRYLNSFSNTYLREEIQAEQIVRNMAPFRLFLEVAANASGTMLNASKLGRQCGIDPKSAQRYFEILNDTLIGFYLPAFQASVRRRQAQHPKFYFFDTGVTRAAGQTLIGRVNRGTYEFGKLFEQLVILEAIRLNDYFESGFQFSYLRTAGNLEIDLILTRGRNEIVAIEIKSHAQPEVAIVDTINALTKGLKNCVRYVFCTTTQPAVIDGVKIVNWQQGLREIFDF